MTGHSASTWYCPTECPRTTTGRHIHAALVMGAQGVWMGAAWLTTAEHEMPEVPRRKLLAAGSDDTVISRADSGKTLRHIGSAWSEE